MKKNLNTTPRNYLSMLIALLISLLVNYYFGHHTGFLLPLTTLLVMQTPVGNTLYQGLLRLFIVFLLIILAALYFQTKTFFYFAMYDAIIGAVIGILASLMIFPQRPDRVFRLAVIPVIKAYQTYFTAIVELLLQGKSDSVMDAEQSVASCMTKLPTWVYHPGFDSGLKAGHEYFLLKIEEQSDILSSFHRLARYQYDEALINELRPSLLKCVKQQQLFFASILKLLNLKRVIYLKDFVKELEHFEQILRKTIPLDLELIDLRLDYVYLAEISYVLNELRLNGLKLLQTLR